MSLTDLLSGGSKAPEEMKAGTFDLVSIYHKPNGCNQSDEASRSEPDEAATFRATATLGGVTYYTNKSEGLSTTGPAEDVSFGFGACASDSRVAGEIKEDETTTVRSFIDLQYLGTVQTSSVAAPSNCAVASAGDAQVCMSAFNIASTVDGAVPTVERYVLTPDGADRGCGGFMSLFFNGSDEPFGGFLRQYAYEAQACTAKFESATGGALQQIAKNADGTLSIQDSSPDLPPNNVFEAFKRETHTGTANARMTQGQDLEAVPYSAEEL